MGPDAVPIALYRTRSRVSPTKYRTVQIFEISAVDAEIAAVKPVLRGRADLVPLRRATSLCWSRAG